MSMITNAEIKKIRSLREKKFRDELGLFVVEGEKMVREAVDSGLEVESIWRRDEIGEAAMSRISQFTTPSPALAVVKIPAAAASPEPGGLCLALDAVRDPGNMGTIIRLSEWFGVDTLYLSPDCVDIYNPKVIQATMGAIFRVRIVTADIPSVCREFKSRGLSVFGTFLDGSSIYATELPEEALVVMGNESNGIGPEVRAEVDAKLLIPSFGSSRSESLNVSVATAVTLSEFRRRTV